VLTQGAIPVYNTNMPYTCRAFLRRNEK